MPAAVPAVLVTVGIYDAASSVPVGSRRSPKRSRSAEPPRDKSAGTKKRHTANLCIRLASGPTHAGVLWLLEAALAVRFPPALGLRLRVARLHRHLVRECASARHAPRPRGAASSRDHDWLERRKAWRLACWTRVSPLAALCPAGSCGVFALQPPGAAAIGTPGHHTWPNNQPRTGGAQAACTGAFAGLGAAPAPELAPLVRRPPRRLCRPQPLALPRLWVPAPCCILRKSAAPPAPSSRRRVSSCYARRQRGCPSSFRPPARAHAAAGSTNGRWRAVLKGRALKAKIKDLNKTKFPTTRAHHAQRPARLQLRLAIHARLG